MSWLMAVGRAVLGLPAPGEVYVVDPAAVAPSRAWDSWDELRARKARAFPVPDPNERMPTVIVGGRGGQ